MGFKGGESSMAQKWSPPKGISIVYKGKGFRKKAQKEDQAKEKEKKGDSEEDSA